MGAVQYCVSTFAPLVGRDPYIHHGSLAVERGLDKAFSLAERYLRGDSIMRRTFDDLESGRTTFVIAKNSHGDDHFDPSSRTVAWDPHSALRTTDGGRQSPALGLGHELAHADEDARVRAYLAATPSVRYDDAEERRVIRGAEAHAARSLGEATRYDHDGTTYRVSSPAALA